MDDSNSIGTIVYIILMILVFVGSALKKRKKDSSGKKASPGIKVPSSKTQTTPAGKFSDFISGLIENVNPKTNEPAYQYESDYEQDDIIIKETFEEQLSENSFTEGTSAFSEDNPDTPIIETGIEKHLSTAKQKTDYEVDEHYRIKEKGKENQLQQIVTNFDLKKAIIFSEILKPKYFKANDF
ncbi:MAG: hypothetical protein J7L04_12065 [Bacteroidales bacterium]|nr:hypothetical protein [Bacteroidales bacterium]